MATPTVTETAFELEAKRKDHSSWHPCQVTLSSTGDSLLVDFGSQELGVVVLKKEEILTHLRFRSIPLQGDDCSGIKEGEHVLAAHESGSDSLFYDAKVEKVLRVRHCRGPCRCNFTIKWICPGLKDGAAVPSSSIMKLAMKSISLHPIISILLESENNSSSFPSPLSTQNESINREMDINKLQEKQIKDVSGLAQSSKKGIPGEIQGEIKVNMKRHCQSVEKSTHNVEVPCVQNKLRTTGTSNNLQVDVEVEDTLSPASSIQEKIFENRLHLSPLAACAALASRRQIAASCVTVGGMFMKDNISAGISATSVLVVPKPFEMVKLHTLSGMDASLKSRSVEFSSARQTNERKSEEPESINSANESGVLEPMCSRANRKRTIRAMETPPNKEARITRSAVQLKALTSRKRFTCSAIHEEKETVPMDIEKSDTTVLHCSEKNVAVTESNDTGSSDDNIHMKTSAADPSLAASANRKRFTRSSLKEKGNQLVEVENKPTFQTKSEYSERYFAVSDGNDTGNSDDNIHMKTHAADPTLAASADGKRFTRLSLKEKENPLVEVENKPTCQTKSKYSEGHFAVSDGNDTGSSDDNIHMKTHAADPSLAASASRKRFTRSSLKEKENPHVVVENKPTFQTKSKYSEGCFALSDGNASKEKRCTSKRETSVSSPLDTKKDIPIEERSTQHMSSAVQGTQHTEGKELVCALEARRTNFL